MEDLSGPAGIVSGIFGEDDTALTLKKNTARLNGHVLDAGDGDYDLTRLQRMYLFTRSDTIYGGSNEIQRNIISERALGLPREPR